MVSLGESAVCILYIGVSQTSQIDGGSLLAERRSQACSLDSGLRTLIIEKGLLLMMNVGLGVRF